MDSILNCLNVVHLYPHTQHQLNILSPKFEPKHRPPPARLLPAERSRIIKAMSEPKSPANVPSIDERISFGDDAAHRTFQRQIADLLRQADLTEDERQEILVAMNCPCCGAGGLSLSIKIKNATDTGPSF